MLYLYPKKKKKKKIVQPMPCRTADVKAKNFKHLSNLNKFLESLSYPVNPRKKDGPYTSETIIQTEIPCTNGADFSVICIV